MTAADYADWCRYAGLYLNNVSHADWYRTYQNKISPAGLTVKIAFDLVESNPGGLDLQTWRNCDVYEVGADAAFRIEQTALALEAIRAPRAASKIRTLHNDPSVLCRRMGRRTRTGIVHRRRAANVTAMGHSLVSSSRL